MSLLQQIQLVEKLYIGVAEGSIAPLKKCSLAAHVILNLHNQASGTREIQWEASTTSGTQHQYSWLRRRKV